MHEAGSDARNVGRVVQGAEGELMRSLGLDRGQMALLKLGKVG